MTRDDIMIIARVAAHAAYIEAGGSRAFSWSDAFVGGVCRVRDLVETGPVADDADLYQRLVAVEVRAAPYLDTPLALRVGLAVFRTVLLSLQPMIRAPSAVTPLRRLPTSSPSAS